MNEICYVGNHLRTYNVTKHDHCDWEIIYCTGGTGEFVFDDGTSLTYQQNDIIVMPPHVIHSNVSEAGFLNIHVNLREATFPFKSAIRVVDDTEEHILSTFNDAFFYYNSQFEKKELILSALGNLISSYIIAFQSHKPLSKVVETIKSDIIKNFPNCDYQLDEYMRKFPFSYDYLRKLFKSEMGVTPHGYLIAMRMQTAEKLLYVMNESDYNVSKIAQMCGFDEPLYFSRVFKKQYGCSPINYAKQKDALPLKAVERDFVDDI
jgi:AraC-like DNA-binding protein